MTFEQTGTKDDGNKPRLGLIHPMLLIQTAHVLAEGNTQYGENNWQGLRVSRIIDAMSRHLLAIHSGEDIDPKSRRPHAAHLASGCSFLSWMMENGRMGTGQDDRPFRESKPKTYGVKPTPRIEDIDAVRMSREEAIDIAKEYAGLFRPSYYAEPFEPHEWVVQAILAAANKPIAPPGQIDAVRELAKVYSDMHPATVFGVDLAREPDKTVIGHFAQDIFGDDDDTVSCAAIQGEVVEWADGTIGKDRTYNNAIQKLVMEELPELLLDPESPTEWADVAIIVLDLAHLAKIDIVKAIRTKLDINRKRVWGKNEKTGLVHHITPKVSPRAAQMFVPGNKVRVRGHEDVWYVTGIDLVNNTVSIERFFGGTVCKSYVEPEILELVA